MSWLVLEDDNCIHVVPESDIQPHGYPDNKDSAELEGVMCPCKPTVIQENGRITVIHNSFEVQLAVTQSLEKIYETTQILQRPHR